MEDKDSWQVLGTMITAAVGLFGVILGGFLAHLWTQQRGDREYRIKKLEELYQIIAAYSSDSYSITTNYIIKAKGGMTAAELIAQNEMISKAAGEKWSKILGTVKVLFKSLDASFERWKTARSDLNVILLASFKAEANGSALLPAITEKREQEKAMKEEFLERICIVADEIRAGGIGDWLSQFNR